MTFTEIRSTAHYFILIPTNFSFPNPVGLSGLSKYQYIIPTKAHYAAGSVGSRQEE